MEFINFFWGGGYFRSTRELFTDMEKQLQGVQIYGYKKLGWGTVELQCYPKEKSVYLLRTKICARFGLISTYTVFTMNGTEALRSPDSSFYDRRPTELQLIERSLFSVKGCKFLCSALIAIEQQGFYSLPQLL